MVARWRRLLATLIGLFVLVGATTTATDAAAFAYDVVIARVGVHEPNAREGSQAPVNDERGASDSRSVEAERTTATSSLFFVAPGSTRVYSSGADALEGGAISLDGAARVVSENGIDMWAISLQYEGGARSSLYGFTSMDGAGNIVRAPDGRYIVTLTDAGLSSPGSALNTIAYELNHIREISRTPGFHIPEEAVVALAGDLAELFMRGG